MSEITTIGLDLAKNIFQVHGVDETGTTVVVKRLRRSQVMAFFAGLPRSLVGMEACATAHHWARELTGLGHEVRLMPPQYVKAYVKRNKNDAADAAAICEAVKRPSMRFVPVKTIEQQSALMLHRVRDLLIRQRTMLVNALRGHMAEFGLVEAQGLHKVAGLIAIVMNDKDERIPDIARQALKMITGQINELQMRIASLETQISSLAQEQPGQSTSGHHSGDWADHCHGDCGDSCGSERVPQRPGICCLARAGTEAELNRWQGTPRWD